MRGGIRNRAIAEFDNECIAFSLHTQEEAFWKYSLYKLFVPGCVLNSERIQYFYGSLPLR